ncbi:MAG: branched-chain-amino-acid transaminase [Planctomycetes bacterium]|nr:branched-chain-amino-acid transaminase [Planctomycetota bacterium]
MSRKVWISGDLVPQEEAKVSVYDHGFLYGDGVFEGIRVYGGRCFKVKEHIDRLFDSARGIALTIPMAPVEMGAALQKTVMANGIVDGYVRLIVTRGVGKLGLDADKCSNPQVIIIADTIELYPKEFYDNGLAIVTAPTIRTSHEALSPRIKSLNYLNNIMAKIEGKNAGAVEAVMMNKDGYVAECTGDNIFIVKDGRLVTPPAHAGILMGITRATVLDLARKARIPAAEEDLTRYDLYSADECFLTGTAAEIVPVVRIDGRTIGDGKPGKVTRRLLKAFRALTKANG